MATDQHTVPHNSWVSVSGASVPQHFCEVMAITGAIEVIVRATEPEADDNGYILYPYEIERRSDIAAAGLKMWIRAQGDANVKAYYKGL